MLQSLGAEVVETIAFGDHQRLTEADARRLLALAEPRGATLVSTEKDLARLTGAAGSLAALAAAARVLPIALRFDEPDAGRLAGLIRSTVEKRRM
jgi:tetraacyldisaccharide 4'-kinase